MERVQETAASSVVLVILITMLRNADQIYFFLDTPRAAGGMNHRYFVASPADNDESKITHYATLARESLTGKDYIAASRPAAQVSRGQEREGLELLVFAGISTADAARTAHLQRLLETMLNSMQDAPMPVEQSSKGLLLSSRRIADMEREICAELDQKVSPLSDVLASSTKDAERSKAANWWGNPSIRRVVIASLILGAIAIGVWQLSHRYTDSSSEKWPREDWSFLEHDPTWQNLARVTGLHDNWDVTAAVNWAHELLREADPSAVIIDEQVRPADIQENPNVKLLLSSVEHVIKSGSPADASNISKEWLRLSGSEASKLKKILSDISPGDTALKNIGALKACLLEWSRAVISFVDDNSGSPLALQTAAVRNADSLRKLTSDQSKTVLILANADLQRLEFVTAFLNCDEFASAVAESAYGKDWQSREWTQRLEQLQDMSTDGKLKPVVKRLVERLDAAVAPLRKQ